MLYEDFIAKRVAELRHNKGISARVMSTALGQNPTYISQIESKKALPSMQGLFSICEYFDITPQDFFDESSAYPGMLGSIVREAESLDDTELFLLRELARKFNKNKGTGELGDEYSDKND